jgi:hypothetical protein
MSAFRFRDKTYRFVVNGRTGEVQGERPYSPWKIAFAILLAAALIGGGLAAWQYYSNALNSAPAPTTRIYYGSSPNRWDIGFLAAVPPDTRPRGQAKSGRRGCFTVAADDSLSTERGGRRPGLPRGAF